MITFLAAHHRRLDRTLSDGNCLFRALSKQLFNNQKYHGELQRILIEYVESNTELFDGWAREGLSLHEHLQKMKMPGVWGSHLEIQAAATLFNKTIYVASDSLVPGECKWTASSPQSTPNSSSTATTKFPEVTNKPWLEIAYSNQCHYDAVYSDSMHTPPALTGKTTFVAEVL